jgi:hypothetical protein
MVEIVQCERCGTTVVYRDGKICPACGFDRTNPSAPSSEAVRPIARISRKREDPSVMRVLISCAMIVLGPFLLVFFVPLPTGICMPGNHPFNMPGWLQLLCWFSAGPFFFGGVFNLVQRTIRGAAIGLLVQIAAIVVLAMLGV